MTSKQREAQRVATRKYYASHREERLEYHRELYLRNREAILKRNRNWQKKNKDKFYATAQKWRKKNHTKVLGWMRRWRAANRERIYAYQSKWYKDRPHKKIHEDGVRKSRKRLLPYEDCSAKIKLLKIITKFCHWCCCSLPAGTVTIDHVLPLNGGGHHINDNLVGCCKSCNSSKGDTALSDWLPTVVQS